MGRPIQTPALSAPPERHKVTKQPVAPSWQMMMTISPAGTHRASSTFPLQCSTLKKNGYVMLKGRPCKMLK
ncbi:hypothetical protein PAMP_005897 [Pampus punctatissimus]